MAFCFTNTEARPSTPTWDDTAPIIKVPVAIEFQFNESLDKNAYTVGIWGGTKNMVLFTVMEEDATRDEVCMLAISTIMRKFSYAKSLHIITNMAWSNTVSVQSLLMVLKAVSMGIAEDNKWTASMHKIATEIVSKFGDTFSNFLIYQTNSGAHLNFAEAMAFCDTTAAAACATTKIYNWDDDVTACASVLGLKESTPPYK